MPSQHFKRAEIAITLHSISQKQPPTVQYIHHTQLARACRTYVPPKTTLELSSWLEIQIRTFSLSGSCLDDNSVLHDVLQVHCHVLILW